MARREVVSSANEQLILVDEQDRPIGVASKADCHAGGGVLHRAFSIFIFNDRDELLLQQRSTNKPLWGGYWSNTCCSHPRAQESMEEAVDRRLWQELGFKTNLDFIYKFDYHASFGDLGSEREFCWVYVGYYSGPLSPNLNEIDAWQYLAPAQVDAELKDNPTAYTPWFKMEWAELNRRGEIPGLDVPKRRRRG